MFQMELYQGPAKRASFQGLKMSATKRFLGVMSNNNMNKRCIQSSKRHLFSADDFAGKCSKKNERQYGEEIYQAGESGSKQLVGTNELMIRG